MNAQPSEKRAEWTRSEGRRAPRLKLIGARFKQSWLEQTQVETAEIHFEGELARVVTDLLQSARERSTGHAMALPIMRLRASLLAQIPSVIGLDRDLGIGRNDQSRRAALTVSRWAERRGVSIPETVSACLKRWYYDVLDAWAERNASARLAERLLVAAVPENVRVVPAQRALVSSSGSKTRVDFPLIAREVAERLIGEELFPKLGPCELVMDALFRDPGRSNSIELMTAPIRLDGRGESFSMVARLAAVTVPYSREVLLRISASKRTWAAKEPGPKRNAPLGVRAYVMGPERPFFTVSLSRSEQGWSFGEDYAEWMQLSGRNLPKSLADAVSQRAPTQDGWWAGLPVLTTLFDTVPQRTVFEGDEVELCEEVVGRLPDVLDPDIPFRALRLARRKRMKDVAMLKVSDLADDLGLAGQALDEPDEELASDDDFDSEMDLEARAEKRRALLQRQREQNIRALREIHRDTQPVLWSFCSNEEERGLIARSVEQLFGDAVQLRTEFLPQGTHGLRENLPGSTRRARERFDLRVDAWKRAAEAVRAGPAPRYVLICASDRDNGRVEDPVNYYAGIHAMCKFGDANVHHVLPIGGGDAEKARQNFVHRLQSALLDVFFAHSGVVFGTHDFLTSLFGERTPAYIYGVQAARSQARAFSGEIGVSFLLFTRLDVQRGRTDVRFVYRTKRTDRTDWMALNDGVRWLGSQRALESNESWLKEIATQEVRDFLGSLKATDPRAIVLVDWSTMASLWKGLSDEDLTRDGIARIDGKDIAAACPQMTLVRLRRGEHTIALRTQSTTLFQRSGPRQEFGGLDVTGEIYTETYTTTTNKVVALGSFDPSGSTPKARGHYIQSMGYRNTARPLRGQSCYRAKHRMRQRKGSEDTYQLDVIEPSKEDAAIPAPLEVTVMACPPGVNPDDVAIAVFGLRLGYVHYSEWTGLPAPLFFKRKVDDHIIRYRSPASSAAPEEVEEDVVASLAETLDEGVELDGFDTAVVEATQPNDPPKSEYLLQATEEVAPSEDATPQEAVDEAVDNESQSARGPADSGNEVAVTEMLVSDEELAEIAESGSISDGKLIEVIGRLSREDFAVCDPATFNRRQLYGRMVRGEIRVHVPTPYFVTAEGIFGDRRPTDKEALRRFWRSQEHQRWIKHGDVKPSLARVPLWIYRRLQIPQGGYSVFSPHLFVGRPLFHVIHERWCQYLAERKANATADDEEVNEFSEASLRLDLLTQWAVARRDDELTGWLVVGCAHFPFVDSVLQKVLPFLAEPLGEATRAAVRYFIDCVRACRAVLSGAVRSGSSFVIPMRPRVAAVGVPATINAPLASVDVPKAARTTLEGARTMSVEKHEAIAVSTAAEQSYPAPVTYAAPLIVDLIRRIIPGEVTFEAHMAELRTHLDALEREHREIIAAREAAVREAAELAEREARERAARVARWNELRAHAAVVLSDMRAALPDMQTLNVEPASDEPESLDLAYQSLQEIRGQIESAKRAQDEYELVADRATPRNMTPRDAARHRMEWQGALQRAVETLESALNSLMAGIRASPLFVEITSPLEISEPAALANDVAVDAPADEGSSAVEPARPPALAIEHASTPPADSVEKVPSAPANEGGAEARVSSDAPEQASLLTDESVQDADEPDDALELPIIVEPLAERSRAQVVVDLLQARAYAAAAVYVQAIQREVSTESIGDHATVAAAAIESIRRLRNDTEGELVESARLRARMQDAVHMPNCDPLAASLGVLAAGLWEMLFPAHQGGARWIYIDYLQHRFTGNAGLNAFVQRIGELEGIYLAQDLLIEASIGAQDAAQSQVRRMRERAKRWYADDALYTNWSGTDYRKIHEILFRNEDFPIGRCLALIARGEDQEITSAFREASKRMAKPSVTINDLAKRIGRRRPIDGVARGHISANIERTKKFIEEYQEAVRRASGLQGPVATKARSVLQTLYESLQGAVAAVTCLHFDDALAQMYRELALTALLELKCMFDCTEPLRSMTDREQMLLLRLPIGLDVKPSMWPQEDASGEILPAAVDPLTVIEEIESLARRLKDAGESCASEAWIKEQLERACEEHITQHRLLPARLIDQHLSRSGSRQSDHTRFLNTFRASLQYERQRVTHAMALGALTQSEATRMLRLVEELFQAGKTLGDPNLALRAIPDFPHAMEALRRRVTQPLEEHLAESRRRFFEELDAHKAEKASVPSVAADIERIRAFAMGSASSIRAARDMFSLLKDGALPRKLLAHTKTPADAYKEFIQDVRQTLRGNRPLIEWLIRRLCEQPQDDAPVWLKSLDERSRLEAALWLESWEKACAAKTPQECEKPLTHFFVGLKPLEPTVGLSAAVSHAHRTEFFLENSPFAGLDRTTTGLFIPPMLGSCAQYVQGIVIRQTAPENAVTHAIDERCQAVPTLLLSRASWSLEKRAALTRHYPVLLIDDYLVAYAALHPQERLQKLMQVALLTFNGNPYDDYGGRPVPPEMFFGRRRELQSLRNVKTAAVLYGGRRLGKSSLLDQLERDAQSKPGEVAVYLTLDRADRALSEDHVLLAWNAIYRRLVQKGVIEKASREPTSATAIRRWIEDEILAGRCKAKGIYLLIDEADEVMGHDLHQRGLFIAGLVQLCESVREKCNLRFVIAGLHNLTRMQKDENSPLGKFESIPLKPFWSAEDIQRGVELIRVPLEALGFYFGEGNEDMPLRIMAVCNFYPAFIQLYCKRLVEHLYNRRDKGEPPTYITQDDLEKVEQDGEFLADIRSKFKLNLDLDKRYTAIALVLAEQYYSDGAKALTSSEVRALCDLVAGRHFETTGPGAYESLLEEMEILTILERVGAKYTLRTPNIAMMLGDRESVARQLDELGAEVPVRSRNRGEHRPLITPIQERARDQHTFPMPSAWVRQVFSSASSDARGRRDMDADRQLLVLVGNELSGLSTIGRLKGEWQLGDSATLDVGVYASAQVARGTLMRAVRTRAAQASAGRRLHCIASGGWSMAEIEDYARLAGTLASTTVAEAPDGSVAAVTRLALIANPARAYELARHLQSASTSESNWRVVAVPPWTDDAIYCRLERMEKPEIFNNEQARKALLHASCGFGGEIERLCISRLRLEDALRAPDRAQKNLAPDRETFYRKIGLPSAINEQQLKQAESLLEMLDGEVRNAERTEEYRSELDVPPELLLFLQWMGLLQEAPGGSWHVPELYKRLLS